jgi:hypothetical protein
MGIKYYYYGEGPCGDITAAACLRRSSNTKKKEIDTLAAVRFGGRDFQTGVALVKFRESPVPAPGRVDGSVLACLALAGSGSSIRLFGLMVMRMLVAGFGFADEHLKPNAVSKDWF